MEKNEAIELVQNFIDLRRIEGMVEELSSKIKNLHSLQKKGKDLEKKEENLKRKKEKYEFAVKEIAKLRQENKSLEVEVANPATLKQNLEKKS